MEQINAFFHICCAFSSLDSIYLLDTKIDRVFFYFFTLGRALQRYVQG